MVGPSPSNWLNFVQTWAEKWQTQEKILKFQYGIKLGIDQIPIWKDSNLGNHRVNQVGFFSQIVSMLGNWEILFGNSLAH